MLPVAPSLAQGEAQVNVYSPSLLTEPQNSQMINVPVCFYFDDSRTDRLAADGDTEPPSITGSLIVASD